MNSHINKFLLVLMGLAFVPASPVAFAQEDHDEHSEHEEHSDHIDMSPEIAERMGVRSETASAQTLHETVGLFGKVLPDPNQISHIRARFPGVIQEIDLNLGDRVQRGDLLAVIQANDSLQDYEIRAPISGLVVDIHANPGELADSESLLTLANYETVWIELNLFPAQAQQVRPGQQVFIAAGSLEATSTIRYLNPGEGQSPYVVARAPLVNSQQLWTPGLLVEGSVALSDYDVALAVDNRALQSVEGSDVVFVETDDGFEARPVQLGRTDGRFTEVLAGLQQGEHYVVANSYLLKADLEKSTAAHNH